MIRKFENTLSLKFGKITIITIEIELLAVPRIFFLEGLFTTLIAIALFANLP